MTGELGDELCQYITLTDTNEQIDPNKQYRIANVEKYFIKATNEKIKEFYSSSKPLNINIHDLFKDHFKNTLIFTIRLIQDFIKKGAFKPLFNLQILNLNNLLVQVSNL